jgi:hypothetical protein
MTNRSQQCGVPTGLWSDTLPDPIDRGERQAPVLADLLKQDRHKDWREERQLPGDLVDEDFLRVLAFHAGLAKRQPKLPAFKKEMDKLVPLAEVPPVGVPATTVDHRKVPPIPRFRVLALQDNRVSLVIKLHPNARESWLPRWWDAFKQRLQVLITVNLDDLKAKGRGGVLKKFREVSGAALRQEFGNCLGRIPKQSGLEVAVSGQTEALRSGAQLPLIGLSLL